MKTLVIGLVGLTLMVSPAMVSQCPLLIKQLRETVGKMKAEDPKVKQGTSLIAEAQKLHDAGPHAESVAKAEEVAKVLAQIASAQTLTAVGTVTALSGNVTVTRLAAAPQRLKVRDTLYSRDVVEARKDGIARILLGGKTTVTVRELSRLELREEARADGVRYTVELVAGKVRASVARALMGPGDQVEVRTRNAVASVRGTDFIVETGERPAPRRAFGLLAGREVAEGINGGAARSEETVVVTLSGVVEVANGLEATGRAERVGAYETARISGQGEPIRLQIQGDDVRSLLKGLTPVRPHEATATGQSSK